jgi:endonuclease-3
MSTRSKCGRKRKELQIGGESLPIADATTKKDTSKKQRRPKSCKAGFKSDDKAASRPTQEECYFVTEALSQLHPEIVEENNKRRKALLIGKTQLEQSAEKRTKQIIDTPVTDQIIGTMLSQNTTDANCHKAFATLKEDFPGGWDEVANVEDITLIENSIKVAGLAKTRAQRIQGMLQSIQRERGAANFEYLQYYESNDEIVKELSRFKGMGPKTISCVLLFALGRNDFPVDTHVLRITQQMGWVGKSFSREAAYEHFKGTVPGDCMMDLHCLLVKHGKVCYNCAANGRPQFPPKCGKAKWICPLIGINNGRVGVNGFSMSKVPVKMENSKVSIKEESNCAAQIKAEETTSMMKVDADAQDVASNSSPGDIKPEETISGIAIKVEQI